MNLNTIEFVEQVQKAYQAYRNRHFDKDQAYELAFSSISKTLKQKFNSTETETICRMLEVFQENEGIYNE